jgi:hypothetical protein
MDEGEDPRARLRALCAIGRRASPHLEKGLLDGVLGEALVTQDAERKPVRDAPDAVVELRERVLVASRHERDECLVREMCLLLAHGETIVRPRER